jgi:hypothetical protein
VLLYKKLGYLAEGNVLNLALGKELPLGDLRLAFMQDLLRQFVISTNTLPFTFAIDLEINPVYALLFKYGHNGAKAVTGFIEKRKTGSLSTRLFLFFQTAKSGLSSQCTRRGSYACTPSCTATLSRSINTR